MPLTFHDKDLFDLMENFYILTGLRIVIFDENYTEVVSYPTDAPPFCYFMRQNPEFNELCCKSDKISFEKCRKTKSLTVRRCHAGLIEATAPLTDNDVTVGYLMFGQITDDKNKEKFLSQISEICNNYKGFEKGVEFAKKVKYKSSKQILAAAKILDACTSYIQLKEMIKPSKKELINKIDEFIETHINEVITVDRLCKEFNISRTSLYSATEQYTNGGIASFVKEKRLAAAKKLLKLTDYSISEVSDKVGFSDYNYFLRAFKNRYGISPKKFKKLN